MELLQLREKEIFKTLKKIRKFRFVVIGGYAVNAYALPRFSVDCDIVVEDITEARKIGKGLEKEGFVNKDVDKDIERFLKYEKDIGNNFKVSFDVMVKDVLERKTRAVFSAEWVFKNSSLRPLKGRTITEELKLRIPAPDALIVMKIVSCRNADIRDVFMLITQAKDIGWIKQEIGKRYDFNDRFEKIKEKISSKTFKDNLQGVYGYIEEKIFEKHKKAVLEMSKN